MIIHPIVKLFPKLSEPNAVKLEASIKAHGCRVALMLWRDQSGTIHLIDGGHRKSICDKLGIEYPTAEFVGTEEEAIKLAWTLNDDRRHLSPQQRQEAAAELANILAVAADKRKKAGTLVSDDTKVGRSREIAAEMTGESPASIQRAQTIIKNGTPALQKAWREKASTNDAAKLAKEPVAVQNKAAKAVLNGHAKTLKEAVKPKLPKGMAKRT